MYHKKEYHSEVTSKRMREKGNDTVKTDSKASAEGAGGRPGMYNTPYSLTDMNKELTESATIDREG